MHEILGDAGAPIVEALNKISPDLARLYVEVPFVDIYARGVLDNKTRELIAIAALTCLGDSEPQLQTHILGALNIGCSHEEIAEAILQMTVFAGFPRAINSMKIAQQLFTNPKEKAQ